ncbi:TRAP transporter substrate-binding protein DctP [Phaeovulum sp. NW3]|uniref:TRAP transporter substrate-binding protein n=1 Tax=Phaeovulum sp. NW3 TaxID=2934933 RepID=UPI0020219CF5|nr:TRAP transporter substrate-binding protein DctP [Phaeovulum sp. NW3]MCL7466431.1 TRAP transporter substrate-binding protein DctP [Phaeovulum sp. NW3]
MAFNRALLGGIAIAASVFGSAQAQEFRLNFGHYLNDSPYLDVEREFAKAIETRSEGRVAINIVYSGGLGKGEELLSLAGRGAVDMAAIVPGYYADQLPFARAVQVPFVFDSPSEAIEIAQYSYKEMPVFAEELQAQGVRRFFHQPLGSYFMTGKTDDCKAIDGLSNKKIRTFGADIPKMMSAVGAVPVTVGTGDLFEALERGTLDYSFLNLGNIEAFRLHEVGKFSCGPALSMAGHLVVMSERTWQRLPEDIQAIILEEADIAQQKYVELINAAEAAAGERMTAAGHTIIELSPETVADWQAKTPDLLQDWADGMAARGKGDAAAEVVAKWREMAAD